MSLLVFGTYHIPINFVFLGVFILLSNLIQLLEGPPRFYGVGHQIIGHLLDEMLLELFTHLLHLPTHFVHLVFFFNSYFLLNVFMVFPIEFFAQSIVPFFCDNL